MRHFHTMRLSSMTAGLLGAALLMGTPLTSSADPGGKWWAGGNGNGHGNGHGRGRGQMERRSDRQVVERAPVRVERRVVSGGGYGYRAPNSGPVTRYRGTPTYVRYRAPVWGGSREFTGQRFYRSYGSVPVYRDYVGVRVHSHYRPIYGWRYYSPPAYYYPTHVVYVRPVRFFVGANFTIGGVGISARYADPGPVYGCNFCDARFSDYGDYEDHVEHCAHAPQGYRVMAEEWDQSCSDQWQDDQAGDRRYDEYQRDYEDDQGDDWDR